MFCCTKASAGLAEVAAPATGANAARPNIKTSAQNRPCGKRLMKGIVITISRPGPLGPVLENSVPQGGRRLTIRLGCYARLCGHGSEIWQVLHLGGAVRNLVVAALPVKTAHRGVKVERGFLDFVQVLDIAGAQVREIYCGTPSLVPEF